MHRKLAVPHGEPNYRAQARRWVEQFLEAPTPWRSHSAASKVLRLLARYIDPNLHAAYVGIETMTSELRMPRRRVQRALRALVDAKLVFIATRLRWNRSQTSNAYYLIPLLTGDEKARARRASKIRFDDHRLIIPHEIVLAGERRQIGPLQRKVSPLEQGSNKKERVLAPANTPDLTTDTSTMAHAGSRGNQASRVPEPRPYTPPEWKSLTSQSVDAYTHEEDWRELYRQALSSWYGHGSGRAWRLAQKHWDFERELDALVASSTSPIDVQTVNKFFNALRDARRVRESKHCLYLPHPTDLPTFATAAHAWLATCHRHPVLNDPAILYEALLRHYEPYLSQAADSIAVCRRDWSSKSVESEGVAFLNQWAEQQGDHRVVGSRR